MLSTRFLFTGAIAALLCSATLSPVRAAEQTAEERAIQLVEETGGVVLRDATAADKPVIAVSLCGATLSDDVLRELGNFPRLQSLDLCKTEGLTSKRMRFVAELKSLDSLTLSRSPGVTAHALAKLTSLKQLRHLDVSYCPNLEDYFTEGLGQDFPQLRSLNIAGLKNLSVDSLKELRNVKMLTTLNVTNCDFTDDRFKEIVAITNLKHLFLAGNNRITFQATKSLASLQNLEVLDMSGMQTVTSPTIYALKGLKNLHTLNVSGCNRMANHTLKLLSNLKQLRSLSLAGCTTLENYGLEYLVRSMPDLQSLDLSGTKIDDNGVRVLIQLGQLQTLNLRGCPNVSETAAKTITTALPKLTLNR